MDKKNNSHKYRAVSTSANDITALSQAFHLAKFDYVDISRQEHLHTVIQRWPLLAELTHHMESNG